MKAVTTVGTVSSGSMQPRDFMPLFLDVLRQCDHPHWIDLRAEWEITQGQESSEEYQWLVNEAIWAAMQDVAPDGYYFGSHPGNGSDYGFWEAINE